MSDRLNSTSDPQDNPIEISVVIPLYNEEENLHELYRRLSLMLQTLSLSYEMVWINDGSDDATAEIITHLHSKDPRLVVIHLSRNFGHQAAICAGIDHARGQAVILMDGDLQDPPEVLPQFINLWREGYDVVYAVRQNRKEGRIKKTGYFLFYRVLRYISDFDIPLDTGDFCLMDRKVVDVLKHLPERSRFIRGLRTFVGFRQTGLAYERAERNAGKPKYTFRALCTLAIDGLVSFSGYPLHLSAYIGLISVIIATTLGIWVVYSVLCNPVVPVGWASIVVVVLFMGAMQLISPAIIGEYLRRIFIETKGRPTYIIREIQADTGAKQSRSVSLSDSVDWKTMFDTLER
jgi:polyisoprenyl-phosphate glycosyltransferase